MVALVSAHLYFEFLWKTEGSGPSKLFFTGLKWPTVFSGSIMRTFFPFLKTENLWRALFTSVLYLSKIDSKL